MPVKPSGHKLCPCAFCIALHRGRRKQEHFTFSPTGPSENKTHLRFPHRGCGKKTFCIALRTGRGKQRHFIVSPTAPPSKKTICVFPTGAGKKKAFRILWIPEWVPVAFTGLEKDSKEFLGFPSGFCMPRPCVSLMFFSWRRQSSL